MYVWFGHFRVCVFIRCVMLYMLYLELVLVLDCSCDFVVPFRVTFVAIPCQSGSVCNCAMFISCIVFKSSIVVYISSCD